MNVAIEPNTKTEKPSPKAVTECTLALRGQSADWEAVVRTLIAASTDPEAAATQVVHELYLRHKDDSVAKATQPSVELRIRVDMTRFLSWCAVHYRVDCKDALEWLTTEAVRGCNVYWFGNLIGLLGRNPTREEIYGLAAAYKSPRNLRDRSPNAPGEIERLARHYYGTSAETYIRSLFS